MVVGLFLNDDQGLRPEGLVLLDVFLPGHRSAFGKGLAGGLLAQRDFAAGACLGQARSPTLVGVEIYDGVVRFLVRPVGAVGHNFHSQIVAAPVKGAETSLPAFSTAHSVVWAFACDLYVVDVAFL